jgi:DUF1365 family protein
MKTYIFTVANPTRTITITADSFSEARTKLQAQLSN